MSKLNREGSWCIFAHPSSFPVYSHSKYLVLHKRSEDGGTQPTYVQAWAIPAVVHMALTVMVVAVFVLVVTRVAEW